MVGMGTLKKQKVYFRAYKNTNYKQLKFWNYQSGSAYQKQKPTCNWAKEQVTRHHLINYSLQADQELGEVVNPYAAGG